MVTFVVSVPVMCCTNFVSSVACNRNSPLLLSRIKSFTLQMYGARSLSFPFDFIILRAADALAIQLSTIPACKPLSFDSEAANSGGHRTGVAGRVAEMTSGLEETSPHSSDLAWIRYELPYFLRRDMPVSTARAHSSITNTSLCATNTSRP